MNYNNIYLSFFCPVTSDSELHTKTVSPSGLCFTSQIIVTISTVSRVCHPPDEVTGAGVNNRLSTRGHYYITFCSGAEYKRAVVEVLIYLVRGRCWVKWGNYKEVCVGSLNSSSGLYLPHGRSCGGKSGIYVTWWCSSGVYFLEKERSKPFPSLLSFIRPSKAGIILFIIVHHHNIIV